MVLRTVVLAFMLTAAPFAASALAAGGGALDAQRRAQLEGGTVAERTAVLVWLAEHGSPSDTAVVLPRLQDGDGEVRTLAELTLWSMWLRSGDAQADAWMSEGNALLSAGDLDAAIAAFTRIVERLPEFAEGYNKRATALYLRGDYEGSLVDIAATLKRTPSHFGALSGAGLCLVKLDRPADALFYFDRALAVNPNMDGVKAMAEALRGTLRRSRA
jgi:tetratricopeptide (TPR) repeat protein